MWRSSSYWDYIFLEDEVMLIEIVSARLVIGLLFAIFLPFWFVLGFGGGGALGATIAALIGMVATDKLAKSRRKRLGTNSSQELISTGKVKIRLLGRASGQQRSREEISFSAWKLTRPAKRLSRRRTSNL